MANMMLNRSTKGASKLRRELINVEINSIRDLLPLHDGVRKRLSQLQVMAVCKAFIGKNNFFNKIPQLCCSESNSIPTNVDFSQTLSGFLLLANADGKFLYLSDNIMEVLGHSMVDFITQTESAFDLFDERGQSILLNLLSGVHGNQDGMTSGDEVTFTCLMGLSKNARRHPGLDRQKAMTVTARLLKSTSYLDDSAPVLAAFCLPCSPMFLAGVERAPAFNTMICQSGHSADMKFISADSNLEWHLGYGIGELRGRSWYEFLHPEHESEFSGKHMELISNGNNFVSSIFVRLQTKYGHFIWLHLLMRLAPTVDSTADQSEIVCIGHVLDDEQVSFLKEREQVETQVNSRAFQNTNSILFPFSMDEGLLATPSDYLDSAAATVWTNGAQPERRPKRKAARGDQGQGDVRPRKAMLIQMADEEPILAVSDDSYSSTTLSEADQFGLGLVEAFPVGAATFKDIYQSDFELKSEEQFMPAALSPYSMLSESGYGSSPRSISEDEHSFFTAIPVSTKNPVKDANLPYLSSYDELTDIKNFTHFDAHILPSPTQEVQSELPELDLAFLNAYLPTVEDGKKHHNSQAFYPPSYAGYNWQQQNQTPLTARQNGLATPGYKSQSVHRTDRYLEKVEDGCVPGNNAASTVQFSESAFLERLIESPQFTDLIGMMSGGGGGVGGGVGARGGGGVSSQKRVGLMEQGLF